MNELLGALTRLANAAATYLEQPTCPELPFGKREVPSNMIDVAARPPHTAPMVEPVVAQKKERKTRTTKAVATGATATEAPRMTDAEALEALDETVKAYCQRFNHPRAGDKSGKPEGFYQVKELLANEYKVARMRDLTPLQVFAVMAHLKGVLKQNEVTATDPTGIEV